jgi:hypothetical protein
MTICMVKRQRRENSVTAQSKKMEASEKEGPMMQPPSKAKDLEAPWKVADMSPHQKAEETGI